MAKTKSRFDNPYFNMLRLAWQHAKGERHNYLITYALFVIAALIAALYPIIWGVFINRLQLEGSDVLRDAWLYVGAYMLVRLSNWIFHGIGRVMERTLAFNIGRNYLYSLYHKAMHLPVRWHKDHHSGQTISRIQKAHAALRNFYDGGFRYMSSLSKFVFAFAAILYFSPLFGSIAVCMGACITFIIFKFDERYVVVAKESNEREHVVSSNLFDSLSNIITVITLRLEKRMEISLMEKIKDIWPPYRKKILINEWKWFTTDMLVGLIYSVTVLGYIYQHWTPGEVFLVGGLVTLVGYVNQFSSVFQDFAWLYTQVLQYDTDVKTAENITQAYDEYHLPTDEERLPKNWKEIQIQQLNFRHSDDFIADGSQVMRGRLHDVAIRIERGKKIALIGESGSGKSTLLALLRGLYPTEPGTLTVVDGHASEGLHIIGSRVTLFPQEPEIFENTIEYNITLGLPFEQEEIEKALQTAHFKEVVQQLPRGIHSSIQEKGVNLSGGQKQRLALARGVFVAKFSDIILLDEPTSSVDPKTEVKIYDKMFAQFSDKAIVSTLHRLHMLPKFDYIYVMENGRIADEGTFEELRETSAIFQELWRHQEEDANA